MTHFLAAIAALSRQVADRRETLQRLSLLLAVTLLLFFIWGGNQPSAAGLFEPPWDKLAHFTWFAVLSGLLGIGVNPRSYVPIALFCIGVGMWDEWRQMTLPGRSAGFDDLIADSLGVLLGLLLAPKIVRTWL